MRREGSRRKPSGYRLIRAGDVRHRSQIVDGAHQHTPRDHVIECDFPYFFLLDQKTFDRERGAAALQVDAVTS